MAWPVGDADQGWLGSGLDSQVSTVGLELALRYPLAWFVLPGSGLLPLQQSSP